MSRKNRRRTLFIDARIQGPMLLRVAAYWFSLIWAAIVVLVGAPFAIGAAISQHPPTLVEIASRVGGQLWPAFFVATMLLPIVLLDILRQSHRIVGPIVRVRRALRDLADGKQIEPIYFRKGDYWAETGEAINRLQENLLAASAPCPLPSPKSSPKSDASADAKSDEKKPRASDPTLTLLLPRARSAGDLEPLPFDDEAEDRETVILRDVQALRVVHDEEDAGEEASAESPVDSNATDATYVFDDLTSEMPEFAPSAPEDESDAELRETVQFDGKIPAHD